MITLVLVLRELNRPRLDIPARSDTAMAIHFGRGLYTANVLENERAVIELVDAEDPPVTAVVLDLERMVTIGITVIDALEDLDRELTRRSIVLASGPPASRCDPDRVEDDVVSGDGCCRAGARHRQRRPRLGHGLRCLMFFPRTPTPDSLTR
ncbi:hypothetical protein [Microbacterium elymi]|uniref:CheW-like domain-containing protein n=1 Tax=Microbacterium elymi TaxID=2909587 RepID=A0ABY5NMB4_9MICO|nr:hypothetical protein [Microbacterium elymi]UUT36287.1 hypothetical protein L2X98_25280 [Microbacterium elymi]